MATRAAWPTHRVGVWVQALGAPRIPGPALLPPPVSIRRGLWSLSEPLLCFLAYLAPACPRFSLLGVLRFRCRAGGMGVNVWLLGRSQHQCQQKLEAFIGPLGLRDCLAPGHEAESISGLSWLRTEPPHCSDPWKAHHHGLSLDVSRLSVLTNHSPEYAGCRHREVPRGNFLVLR